jgi:hypothetical protein
MFLEDHEIDFLYSLDAITGRWSVYGFVNQSTRLFSGIARASQWRFFQIDDDPNHAQIEAGRGFERVPRHAFL